MDKALGVGLVMRMTVHVAEHVPPV